MTILSCSYLSAFLIGELQIYLSLIDCLTFAVQRDIVKVGNVELRKYYMQILEEYITNDDIKNVML